MISQQQTISATNAIAIPCSFITRDQNEMQLCENNAKAEWVDHCMYQRIVNGIYEKRSLRRPCSYNYLAQREFEIKTQKSIDNIIRYRHKNLNKEEDLSSQNEDYFLAYDYDDASTCSQHTARSSDSQWSCSQDLPVSMDSLNSSYTPTFDEVFSDSNSSRNDCEDEIFSMDL